MASALAWPMVFLISFNSSAHLSDCADVIGTVFDDLNRNGFHDQKEPGIPGVRIVTVQGIRASTDRHGRLHLPCADMPDRQIGSNIVVKLDTRTLPFGYEVTTENPLLVRLTAGKMTELTFGAARGRIVRVTLRDQDFRKGSDRLTPEAAAQLETLFPVLREQKAVVEIHYLGDVSHLSQRRTKRIKRIITGRWKRIGAYKLEMQTRIEARADQALPE